MRCLDWSNMAKHYLFAGWWEEVNPMLRLNCVGFYFPRSSKIPPSSHHPMFSTSWLGFPAHVNQGWRGQNSKLWSSPFLWCFCKKKQKETCSRPLNLNSSRKKNRMHRKLIGSILYKQSCTAQGLAIKRAKLKHVFKRPVHTHCIFQGWPTCCSHDFTFRLLKVWARWPRWRVEGRPANEIMSLGQQNVLL